MEDYIGFDITWEEVERAKDEWTATRQALTDATQAESAKALSASFIAWDKYRKLKREYQNGN